MLHDLVEIAAQRVHQFGDLAAPLVVEAHVPEGFLQLINQFSRHPGEIVDEIERVLDLVCDSRCQLTERSEFLCLNQPVLRRAQILQRRRQFASAGLNAFEQANILNRNRCLVSKCCNQFNLLVSEWPDFGTCQRQNADWSAFAQHRNTKNRAIGIESPPFEIVFRISLNVRYMNGFAF